MTPSTAAEAERQADKAREDLARTLELLRDNLTPRRLAGEAMAATRARTPDWLGRAWEAASSPAGIGLVGATAASIAVTLMRRRGRRSSGGAKLRLDRLKVDRKQAKRRLAPRTGLRWGA